MTEQNEQIDEKTLDKLRKLMNHRDSAAEIGNEAEAAAFAERVTYLLTKHRLEEEQIRLSDIGDIKIDREYVRMEEYGLPGRRYRVEWTEDLAQAIAAHTFCRILVSQRSNSVWFVGRPQDRQVAAFMFVTLVRAALKMVDKLMRLKKSVQSLKPAEERIDFRGFRESFLEGFSTGIWRRLREQREAAGHGESMALVLTRSSKELDVFFEGMGEAKGTPRGGAWNALGRAAGEEYAKNVPLQQGMKAGKKAKQIE